MAGSRAAGPHAVCSVDSTTYGYDANGNLTGGAGRGVTYNASNRVVSINSAPMPSQGNDTGVVNFAYGADANRVLQKAVAGGITSRTVYVGLGGTGRSLYERTSRTGAPTEHIEYIYAGGAHGANAFAMRVEMDDGSSNATQVALKYNHFDHLGSVTAISDTQGRVQSGGWAGPNATTFAYDAWGARRNPDGTSANPASFNLQTGHREFTGHEAIPNVGLVNMNGRVYDPVLGRFMSPDPTVQFVGDMQSYNRYSYVQNNPLKYTDPTGFSILGVVKNVGIGLAFTAAAAGCAFTEGVGCGVMVGVISTLYSTTSVLANGGSLKQAIAIAVVGAAAGQLGGLAGGAVASGIDASMKSVAAKVVAGAIAGGVSSAITTKVFGGGNLGESILMGTAMGAASAGLTAAIQYQGTLSKTDAAEHRADRAGAGSGSGKLARAAELSPELIDLQIDAELRRGLDAYDSQSSDAVAMKLPADPSGLDSDWQPDPSHRDPNGTRMRHPSGDYLDFAKAQEGKPGWRGKDHWHWNNGAEHLKPGQEVPDPAPVSDDPKSTPGPTNEEKETPQEPAPEPKKVPFMPLPLGPPPALPFPVFEFPIPLFI
jgi:RHS repeat-associated protein